jgi:hypothetical protein
MEIYLELPRNACASSFVACAGVERRRQQVAAKICIFACQNLFGHVMSN